MPKQTNEFQQLIHLITEQLAPSRAKVTQSKMLRNHVTDEEREVDIIIEYEVGIHSSIIGIECISQKRKAGSDWVEQIWGKHQNLPIHQTVLVSKSGFSKHAEDLARKKNIETLTLATALETDWLKAFTFQSLLLPYITNITVVFLPSSSLPEPQQLPEAILYHPDGEAKGTIYEVAERRVSDPAFIKAVEEYTFTDGNTVINFDLTLAEGVYLLHNGEKQFIHHLEAQAKARKELIVITPAHAIYDTVNVAYGSGKIIGHKIQFALVKRPNGETTVTIALEKLKKKNPKQQKEKK